MLGYYIMLLEWFGVIVTMKNKYFFGTYVNFLHLQEIVFLIDNPLLRSVVQNTYNLFIFGLIWDLK